MSERDFKSLPFTNLKAEAKGRIRAGIAAVFGNIDAAGDRIMPGAFAKTLAEGAKRCKFLWNHSYQHPPIASIIELRELSRNELPGEVLEKAPDATGGLLVKREYYDVDLANWILQAVDSGDINEMSFAFDTIQASTRTEVDPNDSEKTREVRELLELKLYDTSDVLWGCNFATVASGAKADLPPLGVIASQLAMIQSEIKAGRRNAANDLKLIELIHQSTVDLGATCIKAEDEDGKNGNPAEPETKADDSTDGGEAGAAPESTPLSELSLRAMKLRANNLRL